MLLTPAIPAYYANDWLMVASTFLVTFTSLCADYLYIGTAAVRKYEDSAGLLCYYSSRNALCS